MRNRLADKVNIYAPLIGVSELFATQDNAKLFLCCLQGDGNEYNVLLETLPGRLLHVTN